jgi:hypothetical protein
VAISEYFDTIISERGNNLLDTVISMYIGFKVGIFRAFPGGKKQQDYDPVKRPW